MQGKTRRFLAGVILDADADSELKEISDDIIGLQLTGVAGIFRWDGATAGGALVNGLTFEAQTTTNGPSILAQGTDANIDINITPKGSGVVNIAGLVLNLVDDTTPQLGGNLDTNSFDIQFKDLTGIRDSSNNELLIFDRFASATSNLVLGNSSVGLPHIRADGDGADVNFVLQPKGTGNVGIANGSSLSNKMDFDASALTQVRTMTLPDANVDLGNINTALQQGKDTIFVPAAAMTATVSNGCSALQKVETTAGRPDMVVLDFDQTVDEHAQFQVALPKKYDGGTVTYQFFWTQTTGTSSNGVAFALQGVAVDDNETIDVAYGTPVVVTDNSQGVIEEMLIAAESSAVTIAGTPTGLKMLFFRLFRDVSDAADNFAGDARLIGIKFHFTTNANTDA